MRLLLNLWIQLFFVLTPFFALSMFLTLSEGYSPPRRRRLAIAVTVSVAVIGLILFFAGRQIFGLFGITLDSFRVGAGALLFLSSVGLVQGTKGGVTKTPSDGGIAVVPLAIPVIVGPATTGTLLVLGADLHEAPDRAVGSLALLLAVACVGVILLSGSAIQRALGARGITILSRLTGLILAALAAQMIMTGVQSFFSL